MFDELDVLPWNFHLQDKKSPNESLRVVFFFSLYVIVRFLFCSESHDAD